MAKDSDIERFTSRFGRLIARNANRIEVAVLKTVEGLMKRRIFNMGLDADGRKIGNYSTSPMLVGAKSFRTKTNANSFFKAEKKKPPVIVNGKRVSQWRRVQGKKKKVNLFILEGGYKELRRLSGTRTDRVDLQFRGDLFKSIQVGKSGRENVIGFVDDKNRIKARANEKRFKGKEDTIFAISKTEQRAADKALLRELDAIIAKTFR